MQLNFVDWVILIFLAFSALEGVGRSFIVELFDLMSFILSFILSLRFYNFASKYLESYFSLPKSFANALGFIFAWFLVEVLLFLIVRVILEKVNKHSSSATRMAQIPGEKVLATMPSFLRGLVFVSIFLVLIATFPVQPQIKKAVNESKIGSVILSKTYQLESPLKNVFGGLANDTLAFLTVEPQTNESVNIGFQNSKSFFDEKMEFAMIDLLNSERVSRGIPSLAFNPKLRDVARGHSADMFDRGYFSHYSPEGKNVADRVSEAGINYLVIGENLAYAPSLELAHNGLMNSPGHKANILSTDYHQIAVGIANGSEFGIMFTQVFKN